MQRSIRAALFTALLPAPGLAAGDWYAGEYGQCRDQGTTAGTIQCLEHLAMIWQDRLDSALDELAARQGGEALLEAQQLWTEFRQADCAAREGPGTITAIEAAAECWRVLTMHRALELETLLGN